MQEIENGKQHNKSKFVKKMLGVSLQKLINKIDKK